MDFAINPVDGARIACRRTGTGPALLLVHGSVLSQVIWRGFGYLADLAADHTVITLDLRGHGRSDRPRQEPAYRMDLFVADVLAVLDRFETERVDYVGYSLGGRIGFSLADSRPERVGRFVSVAGAQGNRPGAFDRLFFPGCIETLETAGMAVFLERWQSFSGAPIDAATRSAFVANDALALAAYMRAAERDAGIPDDRLAVFAPPTLLLVGSLDLERRSAAEHVHELAPRTTLEIVDGAGHGDVLRRPEVLPAIRAFLTAPADA